MLVTGVSRHLGSRLAGVLAADPSIERVIGVDTVAAAARASAELLGRTEFVRADIRNPLIAKVIAPAGVDTVVHMNVIATPSWRRWAHGDEGDQRHRHDAAARRVPEGADDARLVVKSTTAVYGSSPRDPALFTEDQQPRALPRAGYAKDAVEVEGYVRGFGRRRPDVALTLLRFTNFIGPTIDTPAHPLPLAAGRADGARASTRGCSSATRTTASRCCAARSLDGPPGHFNVGGDGVLLLSQALRRLGRPALPVPSPAVCALGRGPAAAPASSTSPPSRCASSRTAGASTPARLRRELGIGPRRRPPRPSTTSSRPAAAGALTADAARGRRAARSSTRSPRPPHRYPEVVRA